MLDSPEVAYLGVERLHHPLQRHHLLTPTATVVPGDVGLVNLIVVLGLPEDAGSTDLTETKTNIK